MRCKMVALAVTLAALVAASPAAAVNGDQAAQWATYYSSVDCPHHTLGKCLRRRSAVLAGLGGGRWLIQTEGWESGVYDLSNDWRNARWYYTRTCTLNSDGSRSGCAWG